MPTVPSWCSRAWIEYQAHPDAEAFAASQRLVDEIKARTPIGKRQHLSDGTSEWVGLSVAPRCGR
jgi:molybdopterin synthase catalytic subunit